VKLGGGVVVGCSGGPRRRRRRRRRQRRRHAICLPRGFPENEAREKGDFETRPAAVFHFFSSMMLLLSCGRTIMQPGNETHMAYFRC
jgi:hypothetical protein